MTHSAAVLHPMTPAQLVWTFSLEAVRFMDRLGRDLPTEPKTEKE